MRKVTRLLLAAAAIAASVSCGDVARQSRSPVYLVINTLGAAQGNKPATFGNPLTSDVITIVTTGGTCSVATPCPTFFNDLGQVSMGIALKDVTNVAAPTTNEQVTITSYHVAYRRTDGRNTQGVDVPFAFDGALTVTVTLSAATTAVFELVRNDAKIEPPLVQLATNITVLNTFADITFYGKDQVGNDISVTGTIQINFGNFADT